MLTRIVMTLAAVAFAVTTLAPANADTRLGGGGYTQDGHWSPYGAGLGAPQGDGS